MAETKYITDNNFYLGKASIPAGSVFTLDQWIECGGSEDGLESHLKNKGNYVREWEGQKAPVVIEDVKDTETVDTAEFVELDTEEETENSEDSTEEESDEEVVEDDTHPEGVWNWEPADLESLSLEALNTLYKDHAAKFGISVRAYKDKPALIKKMCSEN